MNHTTWALLAIFFLIVSMDSIPPHFAKWYETAYYCLLRTLAFVFAGFAIGASW